ncbi:MAG: cell division protein PerM [Kribbellaceae bacterium]
MTDLLSRQRASARVSGAAPKPVMLAALVGAGAALLTGLLTCAAVAVTGWLAATSGGASSAVRAGAITWLAAHKASVQLGDGHFSLPPLGLTLCVVVCLYRAGRFAARVSAADLTRDLVKASVVLAAGYGAGAALTAVLASGGDARVPVLAALAAAGSLALLAGTAGVLVESGAAKDIADTMPGWLRDAVPAAIAATAAALAAGAVLVAVSLLVHFSRATALLESLDAGVVGSAVLFAICAVLLPNAVVMAVAFLAGPGFQVGTGTAVAPSGVELGNLPALPLLAALPRDGATPSYLLVLTALVPLLAGAAGGLVLARRARRTRRRDTAVGWEGLVGRATVAGLIAGSVLLVLMVFAGGAAGPGRMADVGVPGAVTAAGTLALAVTLGAAVAAVGLARLNLRRGR